MGESRDGSKLIIVCGLPGSGKTTHAKQLESRMPAIRLCPDEWMNDLKLDLYDENRREQIEALQWRLGKKLLTLGLTVIIEWGTWGRSERDFLRLEARALGATVELHYLSAPIDVLWSRVQSRDIDSPLVTRDQLVYWSTLFQAPTMEEFALFDQFSVEF